ncbi:MAG TPA: ATP-binding protein [Gemmataceae bacterium]|nr:ATP-binding protein [Gemmataceae bacterium]
MPTDGAAPDDSAGLPFDSAGELRKQHADLMKTVRSTTNSGERGRLIRTFLARAQATGLCIAGLAERDMVQGILDYWISALYELPREGPPTDAPISLAPFDETAAPDLSDKPSPFRGLSAFQESDASRFFGREEAVKELSDKVARQPVVVVYGPSGSGKSSLVLAGLLPRLTTRPDGSAAPWRALPVVMPGTDPLAALAAAIRPPSAAQPQWAAEVRARLARAPAEFRKLVEAGPDPRPVVLVVDQFEELFHLCEDQAAREQFAAAVLSLISAPQPEPGHRILLTIRQDFMQEARQLRSLRPVFDNAEATYSPPPLSAREVRRVIERPAELVGLEFDERVVDELVKEASGHPTALPLLQFTLQQLWENKQRNPITYDIYREVGNPREALQRTADRTFASLIPEDQNAAMLVLPALIKPVAGTEAEFVRQRVRRETLLRLLDPVRVNRVLKAFEHAGLVRRTPGADADDDRFEVTHEALIRNWKLLAEWMDEKRQRSEKELQLDATARLWRESGRADGYLLTGPALEDAKRYAASPEVAELVRESQKKQDRQRRVFQFALIGVAGVLLIGCAVLAWALTRLGSKHAEFVQAVQRERALRAQNNSLSQVAGWIPYYREAASKIGKNVQEAARERKLPVRPGFSIGGADGRGERGTAGILTAYVRDRDGKDPKANVLPAGVGVGGVSFLLRGKTYLLTVPQALTSVTPEPGWPVYQPSLLDDGKPDRDQIARVVRSIPPRKDGPRQAAGVIAELLPEIPWDPGVHLLGPITGKGMVKEGQQVQMVGRDSALQVGRVIALDASALVAEPGGRLVAYQNLIAIKPEAGADGQFAPEPSPPVRRRADAGAPVLTLAGRLVGVVFAGADEKDGPMSYAIPIERILNELKVELIVSPRPAGMKR